LFVYLFHPTLFELEQDEDCILNEVVCIVACVLAGEGFEAFICCKFRNGHGPKLHNLPFNPFGLLARLRCDGDYLPFGVSEVEGGAFGKQAVILLHRGPHG